MGFWPRIRLSRIQTLNQRKRHYCSHTSNNGVLSSAANNSIPVFVKPRVLSGNHHLSFEGSRELYGFVRFFAAPIVANNKPKPADQEAEQGIRLNEKIKADFVRLVSEEGHGVVSRREALERARMLKLDLVEVNRNAKPPVCKIMDYHKEKYKKQVYEKEKAKSKVEGTLRKGPGKEVRFTIKTEKKDLQIKADTVKRLMEKGYRVKCMAVGTEDEKLGELLARLSALIEDVAVVESGPMVEKKQAYVIVRHTKFGLPKKRSKKASKISAAIPLASIKAEPTHGPVKIEAKLENGESQTESDQASEDDLDASEEETETPFISPLDLTQGDPSKNEFAWSTSDENVDFENIFGLDEKSKAAPVDVSSQFNRDPGTINVIHGRTEPTYQARQSREDFSGSLSAKHTPSRTDASFGTWRRPPPVVGTSGREQSYQEPPGRPQRNMGPTPQRNMPPSAPQRKMPPPSPPQRSSYGIFSSPNAAGSSRPSLATEVSGDSRNSSVDSSKGPNVVGGGMPSNADVNEKRKPESDERRGKYGIFSK